MTLEDELTKVVDAANRLTDEVSGKMAAINQTVDAKKAELDEWRNGAKNQFLNLALKTIFVPGDSDKWYPVCFPSSPGLSFIYIGRHTHADPSFGVFNGSISAQIHANTSGYGGLDPALFFDFYFFSGSLFNSAHPPIGKVSLTQNLDNVVIWLMGNRHYDYALSNGNFSAFLPSPDVNNANNRLEGGVVPGVITAVDVSSTKANNYVRGGV